MRSERPSCQPQHTTTRVRRPFIHKILRFQKTAQSRSSETFPAMAISLPGTGVHSISSVTDLFRFGGGPLPQSSRAKACAWSPVTSTTWQPLTIAIAAPARACIGPNRGAYSTLTRMASALSAFTLTSKVEPWTVTRVGTAPRNSGDAVLQAIRKIAAQSAERSLMTPMEVRRVNKSFALAGRPVETAIMHLRQGRCGHMI